MLVKTTCQQQSCLTVEIKTFNILEKKISEEFKNWNQICYNRKIKRLETRQFKNKKALYLVWRPEQGFFRKKLGWNLHYLSRKVKKKTQKYSL